MATVKEKDRSVALRRYHSPLRDQSARETRARIVAAAHQLFLDRGYARTSIQDIARGAGVARPTVLTVFGTKAQLLRAVVDVAMAGNDEPLPVSDQPWFRPIWDATTSRDCLSAYAHVCLLIVRRSAAVIEIVHQAADEGGEIREQWSELQANRLAGARSIAARVQELGGLRSSTSVARVTDRIWMANDSAHYLALVRDRGWSERAYQAWLTEQLNAAAFQPTSP